jgi:hypothetical protein
VSGIAGHTNKEVRDLAIFIIQEIYKLISDDAFTLTKHLTNLRPIQLKEIKDTLTDIEK